MPRTIDNSLNSSIGRGGHWGEWSSTSELPNVSGATMQTNHLNRGDIATVAGELYVCTSVAPSAATWVEVLHASSTLNLALTGNATISGTLGVTGASTLTGATNVVGDFSVATNKLTVASASGNTVVAGTLGVTGASTLTGATDVVGNFSVATNKFTVAASSGNTVVAGTLGVTGASTLTGAVGVTGATTLTGGLVANASASYPGVLSMPSAAATTGTDTFFADGTQFITSIYLPYNKTLTGASFVIGSVGGTDKVYAVLYDSAGAVVRKSDVTAGGATVGTAATRQTLAFETTYAAASGLYYVGISANGGTAKLRTVPAACDGAVWAGSVAQVHGTVAAITEPVTFTADKGPYAGLY